ncbi:MAG: SRPBCC family protein [Microthrixaceae bacterium]|nr:SRPBCC family protein [Microthrixaceae bacterium]
MRGAWRAERDTLGWYRCDGRDVHLQVRVEVDGALSDLFEALTDLDRAAKLYWPVRTHHLGTGADGEPFGEGSRRGFRVVPGVHYTERVVRRRADDRLEWVFERGGPIRSHRGRMDFEALDRRRSSVTETIEFSCSWPGVARVLAPAIWHANRRALLRAKLVIESVPDFTAVAPDLLLTDP